MKNNTLNISRGGIFTALGIMLLYIASALPTSKLFLLASSGLIISVAIISSGIKNSVVIYLSTSLLAFLILGFRGTVIGYIIFFGLYSFLKLYIEKFSKLFLEIFFKLIFFNLTLMILFLLSKVVFIQIPIPDINLSFLILGINVVFLVYDYILSILITYIDSKYLKKGRFY